MMNGDCVIPPCECGHSYLDHKIDKVTLDGIRFGGKCEKCDCDKCRIFVAEPRENSVVYGFKG